MCGLIPTLNDFLTPAGCTTVQFSSYALYLELESDLKCSGLSPIRLPPFHMPFTSPRLSPVFTTNYKSGFL